MMFLKPQTKQYNYFWMPKKEPAAWSYGTIGIVTDLARTVWPGALVDSSTMDPLRVWMRYQDSLQRPAMMIRLAVLPIVRLCHFLWSDAKTLLQPLYLRLGGGAGSK